MWYFDDLPEVVYTTHGYDVGAQVHRMLMLSELADKARASRDWVKSVSNSAQSSESVGHHNITTSYLMLLGSGKVSSV
jgi:hypothetical protein